MKRIDGDGLLLCRLQAEAFEMSAEKTESSSEIFIRRFMHSKAARMLDGGDILFTNLQSWDLIDLVDEQYGKTEYGSEKYTKNELYWIGYIYRYYSYTYEKSSLQAYKTVKPGELRDVFAPYHTMDCSQAIERILEAKHMLSGDETELERQYEIFRKIRNESA